MLIACLALAACSQEDEATPSGCLEGRDAVLEALKVAPDPVTLEGTPLSECLSDTTDGGELQEIGAAYVGAAAVLGDRSAEQPDGTATLQLGYLLGAVKRSEAGAQGVGYELGRRLEAEAARVPPGSAAFTLGRRAGEKGG